MVSIVIPVFNVELYINECIDSVINQTYRDLEIILVDDGSSDGSGAICDEYAIRDSRIKVIHKRNGGLSDARNVGLAMARGEYIYFLDSDEYIRLDAIEKLVDIAEREHAEIVCFNLETFSEDDELPAWEVRIKNTYETMPGADVLKSRIINGEWLPGAQLHFYKLSFLQREQIRFIKGIIYEDVPFSGISYVRAQRVNALNESLYHYRIRKGSIMTAQPSRRNLDCYLTCINELAKEKKRYSKSSIEVEALDLLIKHTAEEYGQIYSRLDWQERRIANTSRRCVITQLSQVHTVSCKVIRFKLLFPKIWLFVKKGKETLKHF